MIIKESTKESKIKSKTHKCKYCQYLSSIDDLCIIHNCKMSLDGSCKDFKEYVRK